jgi:hypothetical protein
VAVCAWVAAMKEVQRDIIGFGQQPAFLLAIETVRFGGFGVVGLVDEIRYHF